MGSVSLGRGETIIGRAADCDICIDDELVSRRHALVAYQPHSDDYVFSDLNPTNPSIISGQAYREPHTLRAGDSILIGDTMLLFHRD